MSNVKAPRQQAVSLKTGSIGMIVMMFGWGLTFRSGAGALTIPPILARIGPEEALHKSATNTIATGGAPRGSLR